MKSRILWLMLAVLAVPAASQEPSSVDQAGNAAANFEANMQKIRDRSAEFERRREERETAVRARLSEACDTMYRRDPDATITNKLCFDLFWERGLPD